MAEGRASSEAAAGLAALVLALGLVCWAQPRLAVATDPAAAVADPLLVWWWAQLLALVVLMPRCVTLWRGAGTLRFALVFVALPAPLWALAWLLGAVQTSGLVRGLLALVVAALVGTAIGIAVEWRLSPRTARAVLLLLQAGAGVALVRGLTEERGRVWLGL